MLDFEEERQRYWDDVADWLDEVSVQTTRATGRAAGPSSPWTS